MAISTRINHLWRRYKWILPMSFLLSLLFFIAAVVMCRLRGFSDMDPRFAFSLGADIISLSVCAVLLYSLGQDKNSSSEYMRTFALLIFSVSAELEKPIPIDGTVSAYILLNPITLSKGSSLVATLETQKHRITNNWRKTGACGLDAPIVCTIPCDGARKSTNNWIMDRFQPLEGDGRRIA